jgi:predicted DNA binding CopG/RHH family protein
MKELKKIPKFRTETEERDFWRTHDSSDYLSWEDATEITLSKLKPSTKTISLRLPESMIEELKILANKQDIPYQSLLKVFLAERLEAELDSIRAI